MKTILKTILGAGALVAATTTHAAAQTCVLFLCVGGGEKGGSPGGGGAPSAPEIDATQGFTALAILAVALLILRERFLRQRAL